MPTSATRQSAANVKWWVGMLSSVLVAVAGQAEVFSEPSRHWVALAGIVGTAISGYMVKRPE